MLSGSCSFSVKMAFDRWLWLSALQSSCRVHTISGALAALFCGLTGSLLQGFQAPSWQSVLTVQQSESLENTGISMFSVLLVGSTSFTLYPFTLRVSRISSLGDWNHESLMFSLFGTFSWTDLSPSTKLTFISSAVGCKKKGLLFQYFTHLFSLEMYLPGFQLTCWSGGSNPAVEVGI